MKQVYDLSFLETTALVYLIVFCVILGLCMGSALDVAFILVFGYEAQNVAPAVHAVEIPLSVIPGIAAYATFCVG